MEKRVNISKIISLLFLILLLWSILQVLAPFMFPSNSIQNLSGSPGVEDNTALIKNMDFPGMICIGGKKKQVIPTSYNDILMLFPRHGSVFATISRVWIYKKKMVYPLSLQGGTSRYFYTKYGGISQYVRRLDRTCRVCL